jgi:hypothetical protein
LCTHGSVESLEDSLPSWVQMVYVFSLNVVDCYA